MVTRKDTFAEGEYYHIYNRGNSKQDIFLDEKDYDRFVKLLYLCNSSKSINFREDIVEKKINALDFDRGKPIVSIGAWALMPNHFHLYITLPQRGPLWGKEKSISLFMNKLSTAYSMYFNKKYGRTGKLFEGVFKSVRVVSDSYAKYLFSYIHLNPVKLIDPLWKERGLADDKKTLRFLDGYPWSSYFDYGIGKRSESKIIFPKDFPDYFSDKKTFESDIFEWLMFSSL